MSEYCTHTIAARSSHALRAKIRTIGIGIMTVVFEWQERAEQRHRLAELDERMRKDIGLSWADISREASKPFWRA